MEMMFLILKLSYASVVIPEKYPKDQCEQIAKDFKFEGYCIPAPVFKYPNPAPFDKCQKINEMSAICPAVKEYPSFTNCTIDIPTNTLKCSANGAK